MSKNRQRSPSNSSGKDRKSPIDILIAKYGLTGTIVSALLGLVGVGLTAYFGYLGSRTQVEAPIRATQTAQASTALVQTATVTNTLANTASTVTMFPTSLSGNRILDITASWPPCWWSRLLPHTIDIGLYPQYAREYAESPDHGGYGNENDLWRDWPVAPDISSNGQSENASVTLSIAGAQGPGNQWIRVENFVKLSIQYQPIEPVVNRVETNFGQCGGGSSDHYFSPVSLEPNTKETIVSNSDFDYFTLQPGEIETFVIPFVCEKPGLYTFKFYVPYSYQGSSVEAEYSDSKTIACPSVMAVWDFTGEYDYDKYGGFTKLGEYQLLGKGKYKDIRMDLIENKQSSILGEIWHVTLYSNRTFTGKPVLEGDIRSAHPPYGYSSISIDWGINPLGDFTPNEIFSGIFTSTHYFSGGNYCFGVFGADDAFQVFIDDVVVSPLWKNLAQPDPPNSVLLSVAGATIEQGFHDIQIRYYNETLGKANFFMDWSNNLDESECH
jgi:hypothetical protein